MVLKRPEHLCLLRGTVPCTRRSKFSHVNYANKQFNPLYCYFSALLLPASRLPVWVVGEPGEMADLSSLCGQIRRGEHKSPLLRWARTSFSEDTSHLDIFKCVCGGRGGETHLIVPFHPLQMYNGPFFCRTDATPLGIKWQEVLLLEETTVVLCLYTPPNNLFF